MPRDEHIEDLINELDRYRQRYRGIALPSEIERIGLAVARRQSRVDHLRGQIASMLDEVSRVEAEIAGCRKGYEALLVDTIERVKRHHQEGWTPFPVIGFRLWGWRDGALHGAWQPWRTTSKQASCSRGTDEVPHSDGRCGRLGCGIYATKDLPELLSEHTGPHDHGYLAGMVELTGKVVEHEKGYRAARAEVVGAVLVGRSRMVATADAGRLHEMFEGPDAALDRHGRPRNGPAWDEINDYLGTLERSGRWTSASRSA